MCHDSEKCRAEFEAWALKEGTPAEWLQKNSLGDYIWGYMPHWWKDWQEQHALQAGRHGSVSRIVSAAQHREQGK